MRDKTASDNCLPTGSEPAWTTGEFAFIIRRRLPDNGEDRIRITAELSEVQRRLTHLSAVLRVENRRVGNEYQALVRATKDTAGPQISAGWDLPAAAGDSDVHVTDVKLSALDELDDRYLQTVEDHLEFGPWWLRVFGRRVRSKTAHLSRWAWRNTFGRIGSTDEPSM